MSLIEDAKRLEKSGFTPWEDSCHLTCELCGEDGAGEEGPFPHAPTCPWLALPRIVAALEAAQRVIGMNVTVTVFEGNDIRVCLACRYHSRVPNSHFDDCPWQALVEAMRDAP